MQGNKTLIEKADLALSDLQADGGYLNPEQASQFMELMIDESKLLKMVTVDTMKSHTKQIDQIAFKSQVMHKGAEATALGAGQRVKPDISQVELSAKLIKGQANMSDETLEDSIEQGRFKSTILARLSDAVSRDVEDLALNGDTASANTLYQTFDGWIKQMTTNTHDNLAAALTKDTFRAMSKLLPSRYKKMRSKMWFFSGVQATEDYQDSLVGQSQHVVGDQALMNAMTLSHAGYKVTDVPLIPENLGAGTDETVSFLCWPKNLHWGIWRNIRVEQDKDIEAGVIKVVVSMRVDAKIEEEEACVKGYGIKFP